MISFTILHGDWR